MPALVTLEDKEKVQWTIGQPNLLASMLSNAFVLLQETTTETVTKNKQEKYMVDGFDAKPSYSKVWVNINKIFNPNAPLSLKSTQKQKGLFVDYSALLGAYLRSDIKDTESNPIVIITPEQLQSLDDFLKPLTKGEQSFQKYLGNLPGSPAEKHKAVLKALIFQGISPADQDKMFKKEDKEHVDKFLDSLLAVAEFMRTPFSVLVTESELTKKSVSAPDQQFSTAANILKQNIKELKPKKETARIRELASGFDLDIQKCQGALGISIALLEAKIHAQKQEETINQMKAELSAKQESQPELASTSIQSPGQIKQDNQNLRGEMTKLKSEQAALKVELDAEKKKNTKAQEEIKSQKVQITTLTAENELLKKDKLTPKAEKTPAQPIKLPEKTPLKEQEKSHLAQSHLPVAGKPKVEAATNSVDKEQEQNAALVKLKAPLVKRLDAVMALKQTDIDNMVTATSISAKNLLPMKIQSYSAIKAKIDNAKTPAELRDIHEQINCGEKLDAVVQKVIDNLENRRGILKEDPTKKIDSIITAYNKLTLEDKVKLVHDSHAVIGGQTTEGKANSRDLDMFISVIQYKRSNFTSREATTFSEFKTEVEGLKAQEVGENKQEEDVNNLYKPPGT